MTLIFHYAQAKGTQGRWPIGFSSSSSALSLEALEHSRIACADAVQVVEEVEQERRRGGEERGREVKDVRGGSFDVERYEFILHDVFTVSNMVRLKVGEKYICGIVSVEKTRYFLWLLLRAQLKLASAA